MKKLSREQLNKALDKLKELRQEEEYSGVLMQRFAMCYMPAPRCLYDWDKLPGSHTCPICGRHFGEEVAKRNKMGGFKFGGKNDTEKAYYGAYNVNVDTWDFDTIHNAYLEAKELGYDASLVLICEDCIITKEFPPIIFKFRASESVDYTVSYPQIGGVVGDINKDEGRTCFFPYEYGTAISFLKEVLEEVKNERDASLDETCRKWLNKFAGGTTYAGRPWKIIFEALDGILGLSLEA